MTRPRLVAAALALVVASSTLGCSSADDNLVLIAGHNVDAATIDRDPTALLPSGIVMLSYVDAKQMFSTGFGNDVSALVQSLLPLGPESKFDPKRDVERVFGGVYAMQGADFVSVVEGSFDKAAIERAADAKAITTFGAPLVKTRYADEDLYTAGNVGFVVLTSHTALSGDETGMRRALDRLRYGKLERSIPSFMIDLVNTRNAAFALAGDFQRQGAADAAAKSLPFMTGLQTVRLIGNFKAPGMNVAGALSYPDEATAQAAAKEVAHLQAFTAVASVFAAFGGVAIPTIDARVNRNDVDVVSKVDDRSLRALLGWVSGLARGGR